MPCRETMATTSEVPHLLASGTESTGLGWRVAVSVVSVFGWLSFVLLYFGFWSTPFSVTQTVVLVIVSMLVFVAVNGATWASWGIRHARPFSP
jgi:hypothetical protein